VVAQSLALNQEKESIKMSDAKPDKKFSAADRLKLRMALVGIQTGNMDRQQIIDIQSSLKSKYPNTYGTVRREIGNEIAKGDNNKGGMIKKAQMMMGGMANGKKHMYSAGGDVTDKLPNKGLRKLASTDKGRKAVRNMGFGV